MKIGIIINRIGGRDSVSIQSSIWIETLRRMDHEVFVISGQYQERAMYPEYETLIPELSYFSPESFWSSKKAFYYPETDPTELIEHLNLYSRVIFKKIVNWISDNKIDLLISMNASSFPRHLEGGLAILKAVEELNIPIVSYDFDFSWDYGQIYISPHDDVNEFVAEVFPIHVENAIHVVNSNAASKRLKSEFNVRTVIIPMVVDFENRPVQFSSDEKIRFLKSVGMDSTDRILVQNTRIVKSKGIETAINLLDSINDKRINLVITGDYADDAGSNYYNSLQNLAYEKKLTKQIKYCNGLLSSYPNSESNIDRFNHLLPLTIGHASTYFSKVENFGGSIIQAIASKTPFFVNNYKPVFWDEIGSKGFQFVMIEDNILKDSSIREMEEILYNDTLNLEMAEYNFMLGKKFFSTPLLRDKLAELILLATK